MALPGDVRVGSQVRGLGDLKELFLHFHDQDPLDDDLECFDADHR